LLEKNRALQDQLHASTTVADERAESLAAHDRALNEEKMRTAQLARQLAAKLTDCEKLAALVDLRNRTIEHLTSARDEALQTLRLEAAARSELAAQHAAAEQSLQDSDAVVLERERVIEEKDSQIAQLTEELERRASSLWAAERQIHSASEERDALLPAAAQLAARTAELEQSDLALVQLRAELAAVRLEHSAMARQMDGVRARVKSLRGLLLSRDSQIAALQADLAVHTEALAAIGRDVSRIGENIDAESCDACERVLEPIEHAGAPIVLNSAAYTVGRTPENDICVPSNLVSRSHARLLVGPSGVIIEDAGSTNGCFVNGEQVRQHLMRDGDVLELGDLRYRLRIRSVNDTKLRLGVAPVLTTVVHTTARRITVAPPLLEEDTREACPELESGA
jgi:hypothetical protein